MLLSILVIVELVFERYFFQRAITWQTELVTMLLVASTFIGSAYVLSEKAHVSMEWIYDFLSKKNISCVTARAGNVIGGGDLSTDRLLPDIYRAIISKQKIKLRNPMATRPWQHVLEPLSGYLTLA